MGPKRLFLGRVLRRLCPQCGQGALFRAWARLDERCAVCGLVYRRESGAQTGSMYLSAAVTQVFAALVIFVLFTSTEWSPTRMILVGLPLVVGFCLFFLPRSMALWVAIEYMTDVDNEEPWTVPRRSDAGASARASGSERERNGAS